MRTSWIVVVLIVIVLLGWLLPLVQKVRDGDDNRMKCMNNLHQIILATLSANDVQKKLPPLFGVYAGKRNPFQADAKHAPWQSSVTPGATIWYHILPYIEEKPTYDRAPPAFDYINRKVYFSTIPALPDENAAAVKVPVYLCPSDYSGPSNGVSELIAGGLGVGATYWTWDAKPAEPAETSEVMQWGANCYAANWMVFDTLANPKGLDGTSRTMLFTEKMWVCNMLPKLQGGNLWAAPPFFASGTADHPPVVNYSGVLGFTGMLADGKLAAASYNWSLFQARPAADNCDPSLASSPHRGGINVAMGDGSVKFIESNISQKAWQTMLKPGPVP